MTHSLPGEPKEEVRRYNDKTNGSCVTPDGRTKKHCKIQIAQERSADTATDMSVWFVCVFEGVCGFGGGGGGGRGL